MNPGPFGIDSRPALIGVKVAESQGNGNAYHAAVLKAYWQEARAIDDIDLLVEIAGEVGLDAETFRRGLADPDFEDQVDGDIAQATAYGLQGVPALVIAHKYLIPGAVPYATLQEVIDQVQTEEGI